MKKIAVASNENMIDNHFGHCKEFMIFDTDGNDISKEETIQNPGHKKGFIPKFLGDLGVDVVIASHMGEGATKLLNEKEIEIIVGASGNSKEAVKEYLAGNLKSQQTSCCGHHDDGKCGGHDHHENHRKCGGHGNHGNHENHAKCGGHKKHDHGKCKGHGHDNK